MFRQRISIAAAVAGAILAWTLAAAPASAEPRHGDVHTGGYHVAPVRSGGFRSGFSSGYSGFHSSAYGGYRGSAYGGYRGAYGGYRGAYSGYRGAYGGYGGAYGGYYRGGLGIGLGALPYYGSSYYTSPYYYTAPSYYYDATPPVINYSPNYYVTPPATSTIVTPPVAPNDDSVSQAGYATSVPTTPTDTASHVDVIVPTAGAEVFFNGNPTQQKGVEREFVSPPLTPGQTYHYTIEARWLENGRPVDETRVVTVSAGQAATVDFTR